MRETSQEGLRSHEQAGAIEWIAAFGRHRWAVAGVATLLTVVALPGLAGLDYEVNPRAEIAAGAIDGGFRDVATDYRDDDLDCIVLVFGADLFTQDSVRTLRLLGSEISEVDGVEKVYGLSDVVSVADGRLRALLPPTRANSAALMGAKRLAFAHPLVAGHLLSKDASVTLLVVPLDGELQVIGQLRPVIEQIRQVARDVASRGGLEVLVSGLPALRVDMYSAMRRDTTRFTIAGILVSLALAALLFRSPSAVVLAVLPPVVGTLWTMGVLGWMNVRITMIGTVIPILILVIGFSDSVHLLTHLRRRLASGLNVSEAADSTIHRVGLACVLTSLTTATGFGSLAFSSSSSIRRFGLACSVGCLLTLTAVLALFFLLSGTRLGRRCAIPSSVIPGWIDRILSQTIDATLRHAKLVAFGGTLITLVLACSIPKLRADTSRMASFLPGAESTHAFQVLENAFEGGLLIGAVVEWKDDDAGQVPARLVPTLSAIHRIFDDDPFTAHPISLLNLLQCVEAWPDDGGAGASSLSLFPADLVGRFVDRERHRAVVSARVHDTDVGTSLPAFLRLDEKLEQVAAAQYGFDVRLTGSSVIAARTLDARIRTFGKSLGVVLLAIFGVITLAFRSVRYGVISIIPNILPLTAVSALLAWTDRPLSVSNALIFTICLGIAIDDTIHFLTHYRREADACSDACTAVRRSFLEVGRAQLMTTAVFLVGFGTALFSELPTLQHIATLCCLAFVVALMGDLLFLPAIVVCFSRLSSTG